MYPPSGGWSNICLEYWRPERSETWIVPEAMKLSCFIVFLLFVFKFYLFGCLGS